jgi:hypothetical protein
LLNTILGSFSSGVAASTNSYESIATVTVGSGGTSAIDFTSIPSSYTHLQLRAIARDNRSGNDNTVFYMQFNGDTGTNYGSHDLYGNGSVAQSIADNAVNQTVIVLNRPTGATALAGNFGALIIDILDYTSVNKNKTVRYLSGYDNNGTGRIYLSSGLWRNSGTAISSINIVPVTTPIQQYSQFALYGIKGA